MTTSKKTIELILSIRNTVTCLVDAVSPTLTDEVRQELHNCKASTDAVLAELIVETEEDTQDLRRSLAELESIKLKRL